MIVALLAAAALIVGALAFYVSTPHQALLRNPPAKRPLRMVAAAGLLLSLALFLTLLGPATAVFTWMTAAMLVWSVVPLVARWWRFRTEKKA